MEDPGDQRIAELGDAGRGPGATTKDDCAETGGVRLPCGKAEEGEALSE